MRAGIVFGLLTIVSLAVGQNLVVSTDALCADKTGETCLGSKWGDCCSPHGFCGGNETYCGAGCLSGFGACYVNADLISSDGSCGSNGTTCLGSIFGNCCSATGYCGFIDSYCGDGCQSEFGACGKDAANATASTTVAASASPSAKGTSSARSSKTSSASAASTTSTASASSASSTPSGSSETTIVMSTATSVTEPSQPVTASTGFKAGIIVLAIVLAIVTGGLIWFIFFRQRRQPHPRHHESLQPPPTYYEKAGTSVSQSELEAAASQSELETKVPHTELSGFPISELPADHHTMR